MKKAIYFITIFSLLSFSFMPAMASIEMIQEAEPFDVSTGFVPVMGGGEAPIVKVKWEMNRTAERPNAFGENGTDDVPDQPGAQFLPSGEYAVDKQIWVCAVATDPEGLADVAAVYADIYYPDTVAFHYGSDDPDTGELGCGMQLNYEIELQRITDEQEAWDLFCTDVRNNNSGVLPAFADTYDFDEMCLPDGELTKGTAAVYCKYMDLDYEDPAGMYTVDVHAVDAGGIKSNHVINDMEYLPVTAFETDFDAISYGNVKLDTHKEINGDLTWYDQCDRAMNLASVRNVGNTRLFMTVEQDDMNLGQTENGELTWNVHWDARVGSDAPFSYFDPFDDPAVLEDILDLSELEEMDFSILVDKFPTDIDNYSGVMTLGALQAPFRICDQSVVPTTDASHLNPFGIGLRYPGQYVRPAHVPDPTCSI